MAEVRDVVAPVYGAIDSGVLISEVSAVYKYQNGKRTGEIEGYKGTFLVSSGIGKGLQIVVKLPVIDKPAWGMMRLYRFVFDTEKSSVYIQNGRMALSLWAKSIDEINVNEVE
ncbi:hypothetical protein [Streptococcus salivarius]|uniref:hypothetical protein n=1 Tax=Streptococcus salivarius TaxID=1304 RepID=UPI00321BECD4